MAVKTTVFKRAVAQLEINISAADCILLDLLLTSILLAHHHSTDQRAMEDIHITRIDVFQVDLPYYGGTYRLSNGRTCKSAHVFVTISAEDYAYQSLKPTRYKLRRDHCPYHH